MTNFHKKKGVWPLGNLKLEIGYLEFTKRSYE
jgi:hypothetical protein